MRHVVAVVLMGLILGACGKSASNSNPPPPPSSTATISVLAGNATGPGNADGTGVAASFTAPYGSAVDTSGNVYVADTGNNTVRKITSAGVVTTLAGTAGVTGHNDGTGSSASFYAPRGVAVDSAGNVYVADTGNHTIRKITAAGVVTTLAGTAGTSGSSDGTGTAALFLAPSAVAIDGSGNVYVADSGNNTIRVIASTGVVTTLAGTAGSSGYVDATGATARFNNPIGLAVDSSGYLYVADSGNNVIRKILPVGVVVTLAGTAGIAGHADGPSTTNSFNNPVGVAVDSSANVYVADAGNSTIRMVTAGGVVSTLAGTAGTRGSTDANGSAARFSTPTGLSIDSAGNLYVADQNNDNVRVVTAAGSVTTLAGAQQVVGSADGSGAGASFFLPAGVALDAAGNVYVADEANNTVRKITASGVVTTLAGTAGVSGSADGTGAAARFRSPQGIAVDSSGNVYVADTYNCTIRLITSAGVVSTLAGTAGTCGTTDGTGPVASFTLPVALAVDTSGNLYVVDGANTIRKITVTGVVTTFAGAAFVSGHSDGSGSLATFQSPGGIAIDSSNALYVADTLNNTIRKITPAGLVTTLAGTAGVNGHTDGNGTAASFYGPEGIAVNAVGNVYVTDTVNHTIRKITPAGDVTTVVGAVGKSGYAPGGLPGVITPAGGLAVSTNGILYFTDQNAVVQVTSAP